MIFSDIRFFALFAGCWLSFFALPRRWRPGVLAAWGAAFYFLYAGRFLLVVVALVILVFFSGSRAGAWLAGVIVVGLLAYFKSSVIRELPEFPASPAAIFIPLGFSYLAFELLHVIIDRRRGRIETAAWADFLAFVFFAPARVAGPIKRLPEFTAAVGSAELSGADVYAGIVRILIGFARKFFVADMLASTVSEASYFYSTMQAWTVVLAYSIQIYFDFAAYSDIAIGFARTLGIRLPENFNRPYFARNIREFWERWHMTLSRWIRDYVFMPLGRRLFQTGLRPWPVAIAVISYLISFTIVGAWHGLTARFVLWGVYHGAILSAYHVIRLKTPASVSGHPWYRSRVVDGLRVAVTFLCVTVGWVPFMLPIEDAQRVLALLFGF